MNDIQHLVEAALYVDDLDRAEMFYRDVLGLTVIGKVGGRHVFFRVGASVLLLFNAEETLKGENLNGVKEVEWPKGGKSLYFRDPAGNSVPAHGTKGPGHTALGIPKDAVD